MELIFQILLQEYLNYLQYLKIDLVRSFMTTVLGSYKHIENILTEKIKFYKEQTKNI